MGRSKADNINSTVGLGQTEEVYAAEPGRIKAIRSGGQSGVDRAALDTAKAHGIPLCGWCPKGGWAEDYPEPPGVLALYPELLETPSDDPSQRTVWNVRAADATLIICPDDAESSGTDLTERTAREIGKPVLKVSVRADDADQAARDVCEWIRSLDGELILNVAGPRESECPGIYQASARLLEIILTTGTHEGDSI